MTKAWPDGLVEENYSPHTSLGAQTIHCGPRGELQLETQTPWLACSLHMCIPNPEAFIPKPLYLKPWAKVFRCLCQGPFQRAKWGTLKTFSPQWLIVVVIVQLLSLLWLFCNPMDCSRTGSPVHRISQARILEWVATSFSRGSSQPRDWTHISCIGRWVLYHWATREAHNDSCSVLLHSQHSPQPHPPGSGSRNLPEASVWGSPSMRWPQRLHQSPWPPACCPMEEMEQGHQCFLWFKPLAYISGWVTKGFAMTFIWACCCFNQPLWQPRWQPRYLSNSAELMTINNVSGNNLIHTSFLIHASTHVQEPAHPWNKCPEMEFSHLKRLFHQFISWVFALSLLFHPPCSSWVYRRMGSLRLTALAWGGLCSKEFNLAQREVWALFFWRLDPWFHGAPKPTHHS